MKFASALLSVLLVASSAVARPSLESRLARRRVNAHISRPNQRVDEVTPLTGNGTAHQEFSTNWAGAVFDSTPAGTFQSVTASFVVPTPRSPGGSGSFAASAWVGIDGDTCGNAILQTGVDFTVTNGRASFDAWYEWFPDFAHDFSGITIVAGDTITVTVTASSTRAGTAVVENVTRNQRVSKALTSSSALCQQNAEWIVEDFSEGGGLVPFANFGTVTFTNARATRGGTTVGPSGATLIDIKQGNQVLTSSSLTSSSVTVKYV